MDLTVITATRDRPKHLAKVLRSVHDQQYPFSVEHVVVSDGPDRHAEFLVGGSGARYFELPNPRGRWGAACKDVGIVQARGDYVVFWDDDNIYHPWALATLYAVAHGYDIGMAQCEWIGLERGVTRIIPSRDQTSFNFGSFDTMCLCVRREMAARAAWDDGITERGTDFRWVTRLLRLEATIRFVPVVIGTHL
jgi:glycosyltransferase involved in cell wall biosynthesis